MQTLRERGPSLNGRRQALQNEAKLCCFGMASAFDIPTCIVRLARPTSRARYFTTLVRTSETGRLLFRGFREALGCMEDSDQQVAVAENTGDCNDHSAYSGQHTAFIGQTAGKPNPSFVCVITYHNILMPPTEPGMQNPPLNIVLTKFSGVKGLDLTGCGQSVTSNFLSLAILAWYTLSE